MNGDKQIIVGIVGPAGSGKDTVAEYITTNYSNFIRKAFADPLKEACAAAFGIPLDYFHSSEFKEIKDGYWGVSPREIAQFVGTEMFRDTLESLLPNIARNFWVLRMEKELLSATSNIIIPDVRFQNELDFIQGVHNGYLIFINRPGKEGKVGIENHASEQYGNLHCSSEKAVQIVNDSTLRQLYTTVDAIMKGYILRG